MKTIKVSEATNAQLDWLVGVAEKYEINTYGVDPSIRARVPGLGVHAPWAPTRYWNQMGPIIEREGISTVQEGDSSPWVGSIYNYDEQDWHLHTPGPTPLIAAARCYVTSKLGDTVEVPEELI